MEHGGERKESIWEKDSGAKDLSGVGEYGTGVLVCSRYLVSGVQGRCKRRRVSTVAPVSRMSSESEDLEKYLVGVLLIMKKVSAWFRRLHLGRRYKK